MTLVDRFGGRWAMIGLVEDPLTLWIYNRRLLKSDEAGVAPGGWFAAATEPDVVAIWAPIQGTLGYWNLL
jgi:hypothetical protein